MSESENQPKKKLNPTQLSLNDFNLLDSSRTGGIINNLRKKYPRNSIAARQIDRFDGSSEYYKNFKEYRNAIVAGDKEKVETLKKWFEDNGYDQTI